MGMFDRVWFTCPDCNRQIEFQSKMGECVLADISRTDVPMEIAADIEGDMSQCESCGKTWKALYYPTIRTVSMVLV